MKEFENLEERIRDAMSDIESEYSTTSNPDPAKALREAWEAYKAALSLRPIEEAPRDGTWFLAWKGLWVIVAWDNSLEEFIDDDYEAQRSLTHWLPLPSMDGGEK